MRFVYCLQYYFSVYIFLETFNSSTDIAWSLSGAHGKLREMLTQQAYNITSFSSSSVRLLVDVSFDENNQFSVLTFGPFGRRK